VLDRCDVVAFVATRDADRARAFYERVLDLRLVADEPFALVFDAHGTTLRVQKVPELAPARHTALGWLVSDVGAAVRQLSARGVAFERYPGLVQDDLGVCTFPAGSRVAWFKDPDGNTLSLTEAGTQE
jgi:catechol 2,3-dioxygenase-like lactoylglutathione lyase family enzyme